jgi:hypothetical protein
MRATGAHKAQSALLNHEAREARSVPSVAKSAFAVSVPDKARGVNVVSTRISFAAHCRCQAAWRGKPWRHSRPPSAAPRTTDTNFRSTDRNPSRMMVLWKTVGWFPQSEDHHTEGRLENGVFPRSIRINLPSFHPSILPSSGKEWGPQLSGRRGTNRSLGSAIPTASHPRFAPHGAFSSACGCKELTTSTNTDGIGQYFDIYFVGF